MGSSAPPFSHYYDSFTMTLSIDILPLKVHENGPMFDFQLTLEKNLADMAKPLTLLPNLFRRARLSKDNTDETQQTPGTHNVDEAYISQLAVMPSRLRRCSKPDCSEWWSLVNSIPTLYSNALAETKSLSGKIDDNRYHYSLYLLETA